MCIGEIWIKHKHFLLKKFIEIIVYKMAASLFHQGIIKNFHDSQCFEQNNFSPKWMRYAQNVHTISLTMPDRGVFLTSVGYQSRTSQIKPGRAKFIFLGNIQLPPNL